MAVFPGTALSYGSGESDPEPDERAERASHATDEPMTLEEWDRKLAAARSAELRAGTVTSYHSDPTLHEEEAEPDDSETDG